MSDNISINKPINSLNINTPLDIRTLVNNYSDIFLIPNPYIGMTITVKVDETNDNKMTDYKVKSLKSNELGMNNTVIDEIERLDVYVGMNEIKSQLDNINHQNYNKIFLYSNNDKKTSDINNLIKSVNNYSEIELSGVFELDEPIELKSNLKIIGRNETILQGNQWLIGANLYTCGTNSIIKNVKLNNITFKHLDGVFLENVGQVLFGDSENIIIENCKFIGSKSDGISFGGDLHGNIGHNKNVIVRNCFFDGVNNENRNAITLSSVEDCLIENCLFKNFTRSNMPGAIDMETDTRNTWILKNITIRNNSFYNIGGSFGVISLVSFCSQNKLIVPIENITIENNYIDTTLHLQSGISISQTDTAITNNTINNNIKISNNTIKNCIYRGISIQGIKDITISGNIIEKCKKGNAIGYIRDLEICKDVLIENNLFKQCGTDEGVGLIIFSNNRIDINNNKFVDCGKSDGTSGNSIAFWKGTDSNTNDYLIIRNNYFSSPNNKITKNIDMNSAYITNSDTNVYQNNYTDGVTGNGFKYKITNEYYNNKTYYDLSTLPDSFPIGVSVKANYDNTNAPENITYGTLVTSKPTSNTAERMLVCQWFYSGDESKNYIYYRIGDYASNSWKGWKKISMTSL